MIEQFSEKVINNLVEYDFVQGRQKVSYVYSLTCLMESCISIMFLLGIGAIAKTIFPTIFFILFFMQIKKRSGGLHADT